MMQKQLSLVELATYGYTSTRVAEGSWLEKTFGRNDKGVDENGCVGQPDQGEGKCKGR